MTFDAAGDEDNNWQVSVTSENLAIDAMLMKEEEKKVHFLTCWDMWSG
jgi:hypothetical protein